MTWIVITSPAALCPGVGSAQLQMLLSVGGEVCSAALACPWTCKAPFCKCLWNGGWLFLCLFPSFIVWPSVPKFCMHWCWAAIPIESLLEQWAGILVALQPLVLALVTSEIRGQLLEQAAWGAWDRSEISWADQKPEMLFWQPWSSLSWFMNSIRSIYLAEEAHWGNSFCKQERECDFRKPPSIRR